MKELKTIESQRAVLAKNIQALLDEKNVIQTDMARNLKIPETTVSSWLNGKKYPRIGNIQKMADYFGVLKSAITEERPTNLTEVSPATVKIPILGTIACGDPILAEQNFKGYRYESPDTLPRGNLIYLEAKGDSMEPTIPNGSYVLIREQSEVEYGEIAAILVNGESEATLKRVKKQGTIVMLVPDNPRYSPYIITKDNPARVIGKAIRFTQDLS